MAKESALPLTQKVMAPVYGCLQGALARQSGAATSGQQMKAVVQPGGYLRQREGLDTRRSQFQRQRDTIQALTDLHDRTRIATGQLEGRPDLPRPLHKQPYCRILQQRGYVLLHSHLSR